MSREIKFRAWFEDIKTMLEEISIYTDMIGLHPDSFVDQLNDDFEFDGEDVLTKDGEFTNVLSPLIGDEWLFFEPEKYNLMQFTGFEDKNGAAIFEGDILFCSECYYELKKHKSGAYELHESGSDKMFFLFKQHHIIEVKGNIHETPNLLNL